jgi:predicted phosphodiesterase
MRLAAIADIHGNLPALEAVLADISGRKIDRIVNLGDCVSGPLWPRETMELLAKLALPTVRGNHDRWVAETPRTAMGASDAFAHDALEPAQRRALGALPVVWEWSEAGLSAVHGTPEDDNRYLLEDIVEGRLALARTAAIRERLDGLGTPGAAEGRLVLCGHSHLPRVVRVEDGTMIVNPGAVGCPAYTDPTPPAHVSECGSPHARYAVLEQDGGGWRLDLVAIAYDWQAASRRAAENGRPDWARALATGYA